MGENLNTDCKTKMQNSVDILEEDLKGIKTGRASVGFLDPIKVNYFGTNVPLSQISTISIYNIRTIVIQPHSQDTVKVITKSIIDASLGITPISDGKNIRLVLPLITSDRRKELIKITKQYG